MRDGFEDMVYPKEIIVLALHLFVEGLGIFSSARSNGMYPKEPVFAL